MIRYIFLSLSFIFQAEILTKHVSLKSSGMCKSITQKISSVSVSVSGVGIRIRASQVLIQVKYCCCIGNIGADVCLVCRSIVLRLRHFRGCCVLASLCCCVAASCVGVFRYYFQVFLTSFLLYMFHTCLRYYFTKNGNVCFNLILPQQLVFWLKIKRVLFLLYSSSFIF